MTITTVQITTERREQLEQLQIDMIAAERQNFLLRDVIDRVLAAGLEVLRPNSKTPHANP